MNQVAFFCWRYFEFWLLLNLHNACKENQDNNTLEARIVKKMLD